jgi:hypothetical protein
MTTRRDTRRASGREQVQDVNNVSRFSVVAPSRISTEGAGQSAANLAQAFGLAGDLNRDRENRLTERGIRDATMGTVDPDNRRRHYQAAVERTQTEAAWIQDVDFFDEQLRQIDLDELDPDASPQVINETIDKLYAEKYAGIDGISAEVLVPRMQRYRAEKVNELLETQRAMAEQRLEGNLQIVVRGFGEAAREAALDAAPDKAPHQVTASGQFDYLGLHERVRALKPGSATNETYFQLISDMAIENGDPELLDSIPDTWADGTPSLKSIPAYNQKIRAAKQQAANVRARLENEYQAALKDAADAEIAQAERNMAWAIVHGDPRAEAMIQNYAGNPNADPSVVLKMRSAFASTRDDIEQNAVEPTGLSAVRVAAYNGELDTKQAMDLYLDGALGAGRQASEELGRLLSTIDQQDRLQDSEQQRVLRIYTDNLKNSYDPGSGILRDPVKAQIQQEAMLEIRTRVIENGEEPSEVFSEVKEKFDARWNTAAGTSPRVVSESGIDLSPLIKLTVSDVRERLNRGEIDAATANAWVEAKERGDF